MTNWLTAEEMEAIAAAVRREIDPKVSNTWDEIKDRSIAELCSANQDALIDDLYEDHPDDRPFWDEMTGHVRAYDRLLGTSRAAEIPCELCRNRPHPGRECEPN